MSLNDTPVSERVHIAFFGRRNVGKSSLVNAVTGQDMSVVSNVKGTTTDPVRKTMELLPVGPVVIIDTPGYDDEGSLGEERVKRTRQILRRCDVAVLVADGREGLKASDEELIALFLKRGIPYFIAYNKKDLLEEGGEAGDRRAVYVSALKKEGIEELKEKIAALGRGEKKERPLARDLISPGDTVILVIPIDSAAPKGRLILPQQQVIRDILETGGIPLCVRETELSAAFGKLNAPPALVITDSQAFEEVAAIVPEDVPLTSFSILMARYKGILAESMKAVAAIEDLKDGDRILISEGCTHHRQCDDIGTVKIPRWLKRHTGKNLRIETSSGLGFPEDLTPYALVIHCGGCMLNEREMRSRMEAARSQGVAMTNYGLLIAYMKGIYARSIEVIKKGAQESCARGTGDGQA